MSDDDNQTLDQLAEAFTRYLTQEAANREHWIEIQIGKCLTLVAMRDKFIADLDFKDWFDPRFGEEMNANDRSAAISMGREPESLRNCLVETKRESLQHIHRNEFARFCHVTQPDKLDPDKADVPNNENRKQKAERLRLEIVAFVKECGEEGSTGLDLQATFGIKHHQISELRSNGILVPNGERRKTDNSSIATEVLVHRDFAPAKKPIKKPRRPTGPFDRFADFPIVTSEKLTDEELAYGRPAEDASPAEKLAFLHKYGHAPGSIKKRDLMMAHEKAVRLSPQLRDLGKVLKAANPALSKFLRTPQEQRDPIVPMPVDEFIQAALEIKDGAHIWEKVKRTLAEITADLDTFNEYVETINAYVKRLKSALGIPPTTAEVTIEAAQATKH